MLVLLAAMDRAALIRRPPILLQLCAFDTVLARSEVVITVTTIDE